MPAPTENVIESTTLQRLALGIGDWQSAEFAAALPAGVAPWPTVANFSDAHDFLAQCPQPPELIFLAQPLPGSCRQDELQKLQTRSPLARLVVVSGSWCEGELRTGVPATGVIRLYWYELAPWLEAAMRRREAGLCPLWSLPLDHPQAGRWQSDDWSPATPTIAVRIDTFDHAVYQTLAAALEAYGLQASWSQSHQADAAQTRAGIWEGGQLSPAERARLRTFCQSVEGPVVALLDFPRVEHLQQVRAAGATALLAKPYVLEELVAQLLATEAPT
jgi:hypothetical protein